ncbi:MAG: chemoreceptor glutamine deamidase CheD [Pigmentiphaga sp.]
MSAPGRPKRESSLGEAVAQRPEGRPFSAPGRPKRESSLGEAVAQRPEGRPVSGVHKALASRRVSDPRLGCDVVKLLPNEYFVTDEDIVLSTVLGSCVAACIRDPQAGVGGMNHFMLPGGDDTERPASASMRYGAFAMEVLINELLKAGARRERLEAKVFGGGAVLEQMRQLNIGERNADFALQYLRTEQIPVLAQDLRGDYPRRIHYYPRSGRVLMRRMQAQRKAGQELARRELELRGNLQADPPKPRFELFGLPKREDS